MTLLSSVFSDSFIESLKIMGLGMLGIFIVMGLIFVVILLLGKIPDKGEKKDKEDKKE
ncbi:MAG: OadG family protein [Clostridia bacterium]|nr:OadG family protein [Clostridia bacterium]